MSPAWAQSQTEQVEVLTRGPVHEAFAATINYKATEGVVVANTPPAVVQEIPPEQRPEGDKVTWIPGYWAWDDERTEFLWVSGIWRNVPPGRQWIPGYWWEATQGYQWISGFWADAETDEVDYLSEPPASLEVGPNTAAPSSNHTWIPGTWRWRDSRYAWQPGYWFEAQSDWVWVPPYYSWAPQGWLYVDGYYDYDVPRRGMVFAPVRFAAGYTTRADYFYRPTTVISLSVFSNHLFVRPRNRHYYFGDYYAPGYRRSGYYPSFNYSSGGYGYDPIYAHERWSHRDDDRWERRHEDDFAYYRDNKSARPPHTFAGLGDFLSHPDRSRRLDSDFAIRIDQLAERRDSPIRLRRLGEAELKTFARRGQELRDFSDQRRNRWRSVDPSSAGKGGGREDAERKPEGGKSLRAKMPKSPVRARAGAGNNPPPTRPNATTEGQEPGAKNDPNLNREPPDNRAGKNGRGTTKEKQHTVPSTDPPKPRRPGRVEEPKQNPKDDRTHPRANDTPSEGTKPPVKPSPQPGTKKTGDREAESKRHIRPQPGEEPGQPGRKPKPVPSPKRDTKPKEAQPSNAEPRRTAPAPAAKPEPARQPKAKLTRKPQAEPKSEDRPAPPRATKAAPTVQPNSKPQKESASPPRKKAKASPRPQTNAPSPVPPKPRKKENKPESETEKKKQGGREEGRN